ncbi:hypothetical protein DFR52_102501 [Hoeflea marina]|uniref:Uncharacterized protein n=1 Tax=Hoeflea marina TaxID=274592 RepID=A0A317PM70_9HYPH|nr:hypothetical protein [Hoeflea marina]PWW01837.1 hypothetical protein DFR52_102501 [Hoeflea marina]
MHYRNCVAGGLIAIFSILAAGSAKANEQPLYDRRIEEAVIRILQPKLGDLRGGFGLEADGHVQPAITQGDGDGGRSIWMKLVERPRMAQISWN